MPSNDATNNFTVPERVGVHMEPDSQNTTDPSDENDGAGLMLLQGLIVRELLQELSHEAAQRAALRIRQRVSNMVRIVTFNDAEDELAAAGLVQMLRLIESDSPPRPS